MMELIGGVIISVISIVTFVYAYFKYDTETLRKYPPGGISTRISEKDYQVPGTDIVIEKGITAVIPVHAIHHDPEYYSNPEKFDPDRFESVEKSKRDAITWLPFGEGPRNCLGLRFGMMQARIGLVTLLNNVEFSPGPKTAVPLVCSRTAIVLTPESGTGEKIII